MAVFTDARVENYEQNVPGLLPAYFGGHFYCQTPNNKNLQGWGGVSDGKWWKDSGLIASRAAGDLLGL